MFLDLGDKREPCAFSEGTKSGGGFFFGAIKD